MAQFANLNQQAVLDLGNAFRKSSGRALGLTGKELTKVAKAFAEQAKTGPMLERANVHLARLMQDATIRAYEQNVIARKSAPSYRAGDGRFPGALLSALQSPEMAVGTRRGIGFIDANALDQQANFWQRLNFGAEPALGSRPRPAIRVQLGEAEGIQLRLTDPPRPGFKVPQKGIGYFNEQGQFFLGRPKRGGFVRSTPSSRGIGARRFLDAGLAAFANNFKQVYLVEMEETARTAAARASRRSIKG